MTQPLRPRLLLAMLAALCFSCGVIAASLAPFVPVLMKDLRMTPVTAGMALGAWQAATAIASLPMGLVLDRVNLRAALAAGGVLAAASCVLRASAVNATMLIAATALFGLAWPLVAGGSAKVVGTFYHGHARRVAAGVTLAAVNGGFALMVAVAIPILGAHLGGWRPTVLASAAPMTAAVVAWLLVPWGRLSPPSMKLTSAEVARDALDLVRNRAVLTALVPVGAGLIIGHGMSNWLPTLLRSDGLQPVTAGLAAAGFTGVGIVGSLAFPIIATPTNRRWFVAGVLAVEAIALLALQSQSQLVVGAALVAGGFGVGSIPPLMILTLFDTKGVREKSGAVTGLYYSVAGAAGLAGPLAIGSLVGLTGTFSAGLVMLALVATTGAIFALRLDRSEALPSSDLEPAIEPIA